MNNSGQVTVMPVILPIREPECPNCHKTEDKVECCKHCGYHYPEEETSCGWAILLVFAVLFFAVYIPLTLLSWFTDYNHSTLLQILQSQGEWFSNLRVW